MYDIEILFLPPHASHYLHLHRIVFGPFNEAYNHACSKFLQENTHHIDNYPNIFIMFFADLLEKTVKNNDIEAVKKAKKMYQSCINEGKTNIIFFASKT